MVSEIDEDFEPALRQEPDSGSVRSSLGDVQSGPRHNGPDFGDADDIPSSGGDASEGASIYATDDRESIDFVRPFESLGELPDDLSSAFESYKLAILRHKSEGWSQISEEDVLASLDALKELARAPSDENAPF